MREHIIACCILTWQCQELTPGAIRPHWPDTKNVTNAHFHPWTMLGSLAETCSSQPKLRQRFCQMNLQGTAENANWPWPRSRDRCQKWREKIRRGFLTTELDAVLWELCKHSCLCAIWTTPPCLKRSCVHCEHIILENVLGHLSGQWRKSHLPNVFLLGKAEVCFCYRW